MIPNGKENEGDNIQRGCEKNATPMDQSNSSTNQQPAIMTNGCEPAGDVAAEKVVKQPPAFVANTILRSVVVNHTLYLLLTGIHLLN